MLSASFARLNLRDFPPSGGQIRVRENYTRGDLLFPHFLDHPDDGPFILPTSSSLDRHLEAILSCGEVTRRAIILGSVLQRLKALGYVKTLQRVKKLCLMDPTRMWSGFADDHLKAVVDGEPGLMKTTLKFLLEWFPTAKFCVLSESKEFRQEMQDLFPELAIMSVKRFCELHCPSVIVQDEDDEADGVRRKEVKLVAANGTRRSGKLRCVNVNLAFVGRDCLIVDRNRAIHGDVVEIEPCEGENETSGDDWETDPSQYATKYKVVAIVSSGTRRNLVCTLEVTTNGGQPTEQASNLKCTPMDLKFPKLVIPRSKLGKVLVGKRFLVEILDWPEHAQYPNCRYLKTIGTCGEVATESSCILLETGLASHDLPFSAQALAELPTKVDFTPANGETDLRSRRVVSIDPIGCQDIDDAISLEWRGDGGGQYELGVHIADVNRFVPSGSALDREASARSTSVYLEERRLDMLPGLLCENLCSLRPQVDRFAVSALFAIDANTLQVVGKPRFVKSLIHSRYALAYEQAQNLADGKPAGEYKSRGWTGGAVLSEDVGWLTETIGKLMEIGRTRERERTTRGGAINLSNDREEVSFKPVEPAVVAATATVEDIKLKSAEHLEIHNTIAELMILANEAVAKHLLEINPTRALLRTHPPSVDSVKFQPCVDFCHQLGLDFDFSSNRSIAASLDQVRIRFDRATAQYVESLTTRAMSEAQYVCAGSVLNAGTAATANAYSPFFHFGLGLEAYTHFTSPIRRYADLVVARQIFDVPAPEEQVVAQQPTAVVAAIAVTPIKAVEEEEEDLSWANALGGSSDEDDDNGAAVIAAPPPPPPPPPPQFKSQLDKHTHSSIKTVQDQCDHINIQHRSAKEASYRSTELFLALYLQAEPRRYSGLVNAIRAKSGALMCFVPTFDLRVPVQLVVRGEFDPDSVARGLGVTGAMFAQDKVELMGSAGPHVLRVLDHVELELFVEPKEVGAPRIPPVRARLVAVQPVLSGAGAAASTKPLTKLLETAAKPKPVAADTRSKTLYELFVQATAITTSSRHHHHIATTAAPTAKGMRACFGGYVRPTAAVVYSEYDNGEDDNDDGEEIDLARNYGSRMPPSLNPAPNAD
ncbi:hypothetical protein BASA81_007946 [Batrachochytrium salamandrivorans]|nr:hypothetical protein BASA81_007946 [Batrachochytrium salamandrivorans]